MLTNTDEKIKIVRYLQLEEKFKSGLCYSVKELSEKFGVSERTIKRDIEFLRNSGMDNLEYSKKKNGYYCNGTDFNLRDVLMSHGELFASLIIIPLIERYKNTPLKEAFQNILSKIDSLLPDEISINPLILGNDIVFVQEKLPEINKNTFNQILHSIRNRKKLSFTYRNSTDIKYIEKEFAPYKIIYDRGKWYVIGHEYKKNEIRTYAFHRIKNISEMEEKFIFPENFNVYEYFDSKMGIWNNPETIEYELKFSKQVRNYILETEWHDDQEIQEYEDGSILLKFSSNQKQIISSWIKSFGSLVEVIAPVSLRFELMQEAIKVKEMYESKNITNKTENV